MFKTKLKALAITSLFIAPLATANPYFMGLELSGGKFDSKFSTNEVGYSSDDPGYLEGVAKDLDSKVALRLTGGKYLNDNIRVYGYAQQDGKLEVKKSVIGIMESKASYKSYEVGAGADYLYFFNKQFFAVAGASLGYYKSNMNLSFTVYEDDEDDVVAEGKLKNSGLTTSLNLGLGYNITDALGIEGGYRLSHYSGNNYNVDIQEEDQKWTETISLKTSNQFYVNATYKF